MKENRKRLFREATDLITISLFESVLVDAFYKGILEIQIVPDKTELKVIYKKNNSYFVEKVLPYKVKEGITARLKLMTGFNVDEDVEISDASFDFNFESQKIVTFFVSIIPETFGEKIILRQKAISLILGCNREKKENER